MPIEEYILNKSYGLSHDYLQEKRMCSRSEHATFLEEPVTISA